MPIPKRDQVLIKVEAASINNFDLRVQSGDMKPVLPFKFPYIPGMCFTFETSFLCHVAFEGVLCPRDFTFHECFVGVNTKQDERMIVRTVPVRNVVRAFAAYSSELADVLQKQITCLLLVCFGM